jgi:hypothetical protein
MIMLLVSIWLRKVFWEKLYNFCDFFNKKIYILSSRNNISEELRTSGHGYCDVLDIEDIWGSDLKNRKNKKNHPSQEG